MEHDFREPIEIRFVLDAPQTEYESELNTLILRIDKLVRLNNEIFEGTLSNIDINENNKNVECIQEILEHFKFKEC